LISIFMKIAITGHTSGLGQAFYDHFSKDHEVIGLSRSNGYDITKNQDQIIDTAVGCDLFFNNAHSGISQAGLISQLQDRLPIVTSGSMGADYAHLDNQYYRDKRTIEKIHKFFSKNRQHPMLLLKMGYLENYQSKYNIFYSEVISAVEFWVSNPKVTLIEFDNIFKN
jgi:hypothetical protein